MASYILDSFNGGFSDFEDKGIAGAFKSGKNLNIRKKIDSLSCNQALADLVAPTGGFTDIVDWFVPSSDGNIYGFARDGKIYKIDSNLTVTLVYTDTHGAIKGAWEWGLENGNQYLFWATDTRLNNKLLTGGASDWSDVNDSIVIGGNTYTYPKTDLTSSDSHEMLGVGGGIGGLVICNDNTLALVGYDGSYSNDILTLTPGQQVKTLLQRGMEAVLGSVSKNQLYQATLFSWDGNDTQDVFGFDNNEPLPLQDIQAMIDTEVHLLFDNKGQVFNSDFLSDLPLFTLPTGSTINLGATDNNGTLAYFGVYGAGTDKTGIYSYGRKIKNASLVPNLEYAFDCDEIGALIVFGDNLLVSYQNGSTYGIKQIDGANKATAVYESLDLKKPAKYRRKPITWGEIVLFTAPLPANTSIEVAYKINKTGTWKTATLSGGATSFNEQGEQEASFYVADSGNVQEIQVTLNPDGNNSPEVYRIETFFD